MEQGGWAFSQCIQRARRMGKRRAGKETSGQASLKVAPTQRRAALSAQLACGSFASGPAGSRLAFLGMPCDAG